jgi:UDP-N-acetyl-D-mannosaminuronate dehydrogenase
MADVTRTIAVIGMGYVGIPAAALLADVPGHTVIGIQRRSRRSGWKIDWINSGKNPFEGDEPGMDELIARVVLEKKTFRSPTTLPSAKTPTSSSSTCRRQPTPSASPST